MKKILTFIYEKYLKIKEEWFIRFDPEFKRNTRFFDHVNYEIKKCGMDTFDSSKTYYSVDVEHKIHWDFVSGWRPIINYELRQWFEENNITKYELRKSPEHPGYPLKIPTMNMQIDFEELNHATLFKLTWCGNIVG